MLFFCCGIIFIALLANIQQSTYTKHKIGADINLNDARYGGLLVTSSTVLLTSAHNGIG